MRNRERPVGKRENCQINDIHTQKEETSHPQTSPTHPTSLGELPSTGGGKIKTTKLHSKHPEMLVGKGERQGSKWTSRVALTLGQHPSPWEEMLGSGPGA